jgi:hypothetical protein
MTMQPAARVRRCWPVLRLLLYLMMLLAPDLSDSEPENIAAKPAQPAFTSASM